MELCVEISKDLNVLQESVGGRIVAHQYQGQLEKFGVTEAKTLCFISFDHGRIHTKAAQTLMEEDKTEDVFTESALDENITIPEEFKYLIKMLM